MVILLVKIYGFFKWMFEDYGQMPAFRIEEEAARMAGEEPVEKAPRSAAAVH
ncbi:putative transporter [compost metagenome]